MAFDAIWLSPHADDVVLSAGGTVALQARSGQRVLVLTLCSGDPPDPPNALSAQMQRLTGATGAEAAAVRRREDAAAVARLGAQLAQAGLLDAPDRMPAAYDRLAAVSSGVPAPDDPLAAQIAAQIRQLLPQAAGATWYAPMGLGGHVDHLLTRRAALASEIASLCLYEDFPYCADDPEGRVAAERTPAGAASFLVDISAGLAPRIGASAAYRSQIPLLFGGPRELTRKIAGHARAVAGGSGAAERLWRVR